MRRSRVVSRLCFRASLLAAALCLGSCASTTTTTHPAGPLPERADFSARITLRSPSIPTSIREYASSWRRRLMLLGIDSEWRFDRDMAIADLYGVPPEQVDRVVAVLSEPGGWWLGNLSLAGVGITQWRLPELDCECAAIFRIVGDVVLLRQLHERGGGGPLTRDRGNEVLGGAQPLEVGSVVVHWVTPEEGEPYPDWADLRIRAVGRDAEDLALAIGGGALPGAVQVLDVHRAGGAR